MSVYLCVYLWRVLSRSTRSEVQLMYYIVQRLYLEKSEIILLRNRGKVFPYIEKV